MTTPSNTTKDYSSVDRTLGMVLNVHAQEASHLETLAARLKAADGDRAAALEAFINTTDDSEIVKLRNAIATAQEKMNALAEKKVVSENLSDDDKAKLTTEMAEVRENFKTGRKAILSVMETMKATVNVEAVKQALDEIGDPTKGGRGRKVGSTGSSLPKASVSLTLTSSENDKDSWQFDTFSAAAKHLELGADGVKQLQEAYAKAAGVNHSEISSVSKPVEFTVNSGLKNSKAIWTVKTQPKERKKPGPRPGGNAQSKPKDQAELPASTVAAK